MIPKLITAVLVIISCQVIAHPGFAQGEAAPSIQQRAEKQIRKIAPQLPSEERFLMGEDDLVLLRRRKFFTVKSDSSFGYVSNAYSSDDNKKHDEVFNENLSLRFETQIAEKYIVFAGAGAFLARHVRFTQLNYDGVTGNLGIRVPSGPWTFGLGYRASMILEPGLDTRIVTQHDMSSSVSYATTVASNTAIIPTGSISHALASPDDYTSTSLRLGVAIVHRVAPNLVASGNIQGVSRWYDHYFEATTGVTRRDVGFDAALSLVWTPFENVSLSAATAVGYVDSTSNSSDYFNFSFTPTVSLRIKF